MRPSTPRNDHRSPGDLALDPFPGDALHRSFAAARHRGPAVWATFLGAPALLLTSHAAVRAYLTDHAQFPGGVIYRSATRPHIGSTFIDLDGAEHDLVRRLVTPAFRSRSVRAFVETGLAPLVADVLGTLRNAGRREADLAAEFAQVLPFSAIGRKLGLPRTSEARQRAWALAMLSAPTDPAGARRAATAVTEFLAPHLQRARIAEGEGKGEGDDNGVIDDLVRREVDGRRLTDDELAAHVRLLYAVGATTTSDALSTLLHRLLSDPALLDLARARPDLRAGMVAESLRMDPAVATLPRLADEDGRLVVPGSHGGSAAQVDIAAGTIVLCGIASANRDPDVFADPDSFDPTRDHGEMLTFGLGQKYCPGAHLARRQLAAALDAIVDGLPNLSPMSLSEPCSAVLRRSDRLCVTWGG